MLKAIYASLEEIPEEYRALYTEKKSADGSPQWELTGIEGVKTSADVERIDKALKAERAEHAKTKARVQAFGEFTPEKIEELQGQVVELQAQVEAGGKPDDAAINKLVEARLPAFTRPLERERDALKRQLESLTAENGSLKLTALRRAMSDELRGAVTGDKRVPVRNTAVEDIELYVERLFTIEEGKGFVTKDGVGVTPGMSIREWLAEVQADGRRPHWFEGNISAGASGSGGGGLAVGDNPFDATSFNFTKASALEATDPNKARALYRAAKDKSRAKPAFGHLAA